MINLLRVALLFLTVVISFNSKALLIKLDFGTVGSTDMWNNVTDRFDVTQAGANVSDFDFITNSILASVREDYYNSHYGFINANQELDIDFINALVSDDVSALDSNHYTIQIGTGVSGPHDDYFGVACSSCVSSQTVPDNTIFGSVFSDNIFSGLNTTAGGSWDFTEIINAIAGTLSHEIGHSLGLPHPSGKQLNPGESDYGIMATGASPSYMPNGERLVNRAFSDVNMLSLVNTLGLRTVTTAVPEPSSAILFLFSGLILTFSARKKLHKL